jgi:3-hydroxymyristoyl/3-hydroxydecanoyl-(acyl carrier protein) dehydratase
MNIHRKKIGQLLKLSEQHVVIDKAMYDPDFPNDLKIFKLLAEDDIDFKSHISDYLVYPDYAIGKILNQGIRLLVRLLYPDLKDIPVAMIEHTKLRGQLYPSDEMIVLIKRWQGRSKIAKFEIGIANQRGKIVYESTIYGTLAKKTRNIKTSEDVSENGAFMETW